MKITGTKVYNFLKKAGFNVINNSGFMSDGDGSWVHTGRKPSEIFVDVGIYIRPFCPPKDGIPDIKYKNRLWEHWLVLTEEDYAYSYKMIEALSEAGYACYLPLYCEGFLSRGRRAELRKRHHAPSADFYVMKETTLENLKRIGPKT